MYCYLVHSTVLYTCTAGGGWWIDQVGTPRVGPPLLFGETCDRESDGKSCPLCPPSPIWMDPPPRAGSSSLTLLANRRSPPGPGRC